MSEFNKTPRLVLLPAVDVAGGKAVRLTKGEAGTETSYGDPVDAAVEWADQGAEWIHLVDLDAAFGRGSNGGVLKKVIRQVRGVNVELSGGIRDDASLEHALEIGAKRINLGTAALENPEWAASVRHPHNARLAARTAGNGEPARPSGAAMMLTDGPRWCGRSRSGLGPRTCDRRRGAARTRGWRASHSPPPAAVAPEREARLG